MRNFINNHIRLVTFLVVISLFLAVFIPIAYYESRDFFDDHGDTRPAMTTGDLILLADDAGKGTLKPEDFTKYKCIEMEMSDAKYAYYMIEVEPSYRVLVGFNKDTNKLLYFVMSDSATDEEIDILNGGDLRAYFNSKG